MNNINTLSVNDAANIPFTDPTDLCGDVFFKVIHRGRGGNDRLLCRFGIHTSFLKLREKSNQLQCSMDVYCVDPNAIKKTSGYSNFQIKLIFNELVCNSKKCATNPNRQSVLLDQNLLSLGTNVAKQPQLPQPAELCSECSEWFKKFKSNDFENWKEIHRILKLR